MCRHSLASPPLHSEEGSGVMPIRDLFCCTDECNTNQIVTRIGASLSEPHIDELNVRNPYIIIGASLSEPNIDELNVRNLYIIIIIIKFN